ncbi:MAG: hypothetical protein AB7Q23_08255 [Hyphomonadaceae bacterium]
MNLRPNEELWLEVSEDYAIRTAELEDAVQVKGSRAAKGATSYSLQSKDIRDALRRLWARASAFPGARLTFVANGGVAVERDYTFPGGAGGLSYWGDAGRGADTAPIRVALSALFKDETLGAWLASNPSDDDLRDKLLRRVTWALNASDTNELTSQLCDQVGAVYSERGLPVTAAPAGLRALSDYIFEIACRADPKERRLTVLERHGAIEDTIGALNLAKQMGAAETAQAAADLQSALVSEIGAEVATIAARNQTVDFIVGAAGTEPFVWLHGGHGAGKSTLARLLARRYGGRWLSLDLRPVQRDAAGALTAWRELLRAIAVGGVPAGVVIDDFDDAAVGALSGRLAALVQQIAERGGRVIVTAPQPASAARLAAFGATASASVPAPYLTEAEIADLVGREPSPDADRIQAWTVFIRLAAGGGHPLLVASKIASLRARGWPKDGLTEDIGKTSEAIQVTREEARRALLRDLSALDQARSLDAGALLRRIGAVFDRVDQALVMALAHLAPPIATASDALAVLRGSWLEMLADGDMRISPVIADISNDAAPANAKLWRQAAAEYWLKGGVLNERTLPLCFWNAFWGQHDWVLLKLCQTLQSQNIEVLRGAAAFLSPMTALRTDVSLYPSHEIVAVNLRLLQFQVADAMESDASAEIAKRLLAELDAIPHAELKALSTMISASKVLMAQKAHVEPKDLVEFALRLRRVSPEVEKVGGAAVKRSREDILKNFGGEVDVAAFLYASAISKIRNSDDFLLTIDALDDIDPEDRRSFLSASSRIFDGMALFVNSGWSRDQIEERDMTSALDAYELAGAIAESWGIADLNAELAVAQSMILDEGLKDAERAIAMIDSAIDALGPLHVLIRQKAKVFGHNGRDAEAADLIVSVEDTVGGTSKIERALALRDGGTSAACADRFDVAARLFAKATQAIDANGGHEALAAGLRVDNAMALWDGGDRANALRRLADAFDILASLDAAASRQNERAHQFARAAAGLFFNDTDAFPLGPRPDIAYGGASTLFLSKEEFINADLRPLADKLACARACRSRMRPRRRHRCPFARRSNRPRHGVDRIHDRLRALRHGPYGR